MLQAKVPKVDGKRVKKQKTEGVNAGKPADIAKEIERAIGAALVSLAPTTNTAVKVGFSSWTPEQIAENVDTVATALVGKWVPQKWRNVRSIHIKGQQTAALPIWLTDELWVDEKDVIADDEAAKAIKAEKANVGKKRKSIKETEEEVESPAPKKAKKQAKPTGDDDKLDKQIADRKSTLKKQKAAAKKAMEA